MIPRVFSWAVNCLWGKTNWPPDAAQEISIERQTVFLKVYLAAHCPLDGCPSPALQYPGVGTRFPLFWCLFLTWRWCSKGLSLSCLSSLWCLPTTCRLCCSSFKGDQSTVVPPVVVVSPREVTLLFEGDQSAVVSVVSHWRDAVRSRWPPHGTRILWREVARPVYSCTPALACWRHSMERLQTPRRSIGGSGRAPQKGLSTATRLDYMCLCPSRDQGDSHAKFEMTKKQCGRTSTGAYTNPQWGLYYRWGRLCVVCTFR